MRAGVYALLRPPGRLPDRGAGPTSKAARCFAAASRGANSPRSFLISLSRKSIAARASSRFLRDAALLPRVPYIARTRQRAFSASRSASMSQSRTASNTAFRASQAERPGSPFPRATIHLLMISCSVAAASQASASRCCHAWRAFQAALPLAVRHQRRGFSLAHHARQAAPPAAQSSRFCRSVPCTLRQNAAAASSSSNVILRMSSGSAALARVCIRAASSRNWTSARMLTHNL